MSGVAAILIGSALASWLVAAVIAFLSVVIVVLMIRVKREDLEGINAMGVG
jgi:hypothetical protein